MGKLAPRLLVKNFMFKPVRIFIFVTPMVKALIIALVMAPALLQAAPQGHVLEPTQVFRPILLARAGMSLDQAVNQVRRETGGRILSAKTVSENGRRVHRIKVLMPSGRVKIVRKPAD